MAKDRYDMYQRTSKEHPVMQRKRIKGDMYEKDERPLKCRIANIASDTNRKAVSLITAISNAGFRFNVFGGRDFEVVAK